MPDETRRSTPDPFELFDAADDVLEEALALEPEERPDFVARACAGRPQLGELVGQLLDEIDVAGGSNASEHPAFPIAALALGGALLQEPTPRLEAGDLLADYEICEGIGAGGMGEVYRATDRRLGRDVAIKVLPQHLSSDEDLRARFAREARAISKLNHPNVCVLHDIGRSGDIDYLVMELLVGESLRERMDREPLSLGEALRLATQIAAALSAAHRNRIVHRDLKPSNVFLVASGAKLLDFGIAKLQPPAVGVKQPLDAGETTVRGTLIGTPQYMAPEQLEGGPVDSRTDIFAFGVLLYEMVSGENPFPGTSQARVISAVLSHDPAPVSSLEKEVPHEIDRLIATCLAKAPDDRWQSAGDLARELEYIATTEPKPSERKRRSWSVRAGETFAKLALALAAGLLGLVLASAWFSRAPTPEPSGAYRFEIDGLAHHEGWTRLALSPDGTAVAYVTEASGDRHMALRRMNDTEPSLIPGTLNTETPVFSPDGRWLAFVRIPTGRLEKVSLRGGTPIELAQVDNLQGATWARDGYLYYSPQPSSGIWRVHQDGGTPEHLSEPDPARRQHSHRAPTVLPGGRFVVFVLADSRTVSYDDASTEILDLQSGKHRTLIENAYAPRFSATGHLLFIQKGELLAVAIDPVNGTTSGAPFRIASNVVGNSLHGGGDYAVSDNGVLAYAKGEPTAPHRDLLWVDRNGNESLQPVEPTAVLNMRLDPTGRYIALQVQGANNRIWLHDLERSTSSLVTREWSDHLPVWTPDSQRIAISSTRGGPLNLFWRSADGVGDAELLLASKIMLHPGSFSPDGQYLAYWQLEAEDIGDIFLLPLGDGGRTPGEPVPLVESPAIEGAPRFSPDGRYIAYVSDESGRPEIYVVTVEKPRRRFRLSNGGGYSPRWSRSSEELFYRSGDRMMAVAVGFEPFEHGSPKELWSGDYWKSEMFDLTHYDVHPDGRFLMLRERKRPPEPIVVETDALDFHR